MREVTTTTDTTVTATKRDKHHLVIEMIFADPVACSLHATSIINALHRGEECILTLGEGKVKRDGKVL